VVNGVYSVYIWIIVWSALEGGMEQIARFVLRASGSVVLFRLLAFDGCKFVVFEAIDLWI